jgi:Family of unknown function (DUF6600)
MERTRAGRRPRAASRGALLAIALLAILASGAAPRSAAAAHTRVSFEFFAASLAPSGSWHVSTSFGRVWIPRVKEIGWHPYTHGHWVYSDFGWTWVSDYEWGAITYHYGTWAIDPELGWAWIPGYVWAPAWVVFRTGSTYIGWAPVQPSFSIGTPFSFSDYGPDQFAFVRKAEFAAPHIQRHAVPIERSRVIFNQTTALEDNIRIENDVVVNRGPDVGQMEEVARAPVERAPIERVPRVAPADPVTRDELRVDPERVERGAVRAATPTREPRSGGAPAAPQQPG